MEDLKKIKDENERLKKVIKNYETKESHKWATRWWLTKKTTSVILGRNLKNL